MERNESFKLTDPLFLIVKMLLSEVRSWCRQYKFPHYVCTDFAKVVFDFMTLKEVRCGYTTVEFSNGMSHAIVAFNTDYGLVYVEPQSGDVEYSLRVGNRYPYTLEGIPKDATVAGINIRWNSDMKISFCECKECGYLLPIYDDELVDRCPICSTVYGVFTTDLVSAIIEENIKKNTKCGRVRMAELSEKYTAEISRRTPGCILFLVDQSESMADNFSGEVNPKQKAQGAADTLNMLLTDLVSKCTKGEETRSYFDIGVIGYGERVGSAFGGELAGRDLVSISELPDQGRIEEHVQNGGERTKIQIWFDPVARNRTPMCQGLREAHRILSDWITRHREAYPPIVINITDGEVNDGDPSIPAEELVKLSTNDGNVLLFNCHLSSNAEQKTVEFPLTKEGLIDKFAQMLFDMSSILPRKIIEDARKEGFPLQDMARGFMFNAAKLGDLTRFLSIGTRPSQSLR